MKHKYLSVLLSCLMISTSILPVYAEESSTATEQKKEETTEKKEEQEPKEEKKEEKKEAEPTEVRSSQTTSVSSDDNKPEKSESGNHEKEKSKKKNDKENSKESKETTKETDSNSNKDATTSTENVRDTMPVPAELSGGESQSNSRTLYGMPEEEIHGYTPYLKEKTKGFNKEIKAEKKKIENYKKQITEVEKIIETIENNAKQISELPTFRGQAYSLGTIRTKANTQRIPAIYHLDDKIQNIVDLTKNEFLSDWIQKYSLDSYCSVESGIPLNIGDTSDIVPVLYDAIEDEELKIISINNQIQESEKKITDLRNQRSQIAKERVFNPNDVTIPSNLTEEEVKEMLEGTNLQHLSKTFIECEAKYNINAVFLLSIAAHESAWGNSRRARYDHNFTGYGVYSDSAEGINSDKDEQNIDLTASKLRENYLDENGKYYKGKRVCDIHSTYCATGGWSKGVCAAAYKCMERILDKPVYETPEQKEKRLSETTDKADNK